MHDSTDNTWLAQKATIEERPFPTNTPLIGGLIARFRSAWNSVATKWYVRPLLQQQNRFNHLTAQQLAEHDAWLAAQDHEQTHLAQQVAQLGSEINSLAQRIEALNQRLDQQDRVDG